MQTKAKRSHYLQHGHRDEWQGGAVVVKQLKEVDACHEIQIINSMVKRHWVITGTQRSACHEIQIIDSMVKRHWVITGIQGR